MGGCRLAAVNEHPAQYIALHLGRPHVGGQVDTVRVREDPALEVEGVGGARPGDVDVDLPP